MRRLYTLFILGGSFRNYSAEVNRVIAVLALLGQERGKSGLHRAGYSVTRSEGDLKESATENTQPTRLLMVGGNGEKAR